MGQGMIHGLRGDCVGWRGERGSLPSNDWGFGDLSDAAELVLHSRSKRMGRINDNPGSVLFKQGYSRGFTDASGNSLRAWHLFFGLFRSV
jgi:hypothetical protein